MTDQLVAAKVAPREKFTTIYSGMEVESFLQANKQRQQVRHELGFTDDDVVVGKFARLFHLKGHQDFIAAVAKVASRMPQLRVVLVGDGILRPALEQQIMTAGLADRVQLTGLVPPQQIPQLLAATDLVVHTSLREGLARVLPQALLAGRPVISYDIDGASEVVLERETGFLVQPGDVDTLAERIYELAHSDKLRAQLAQAGSQLCVKRFDHQQMTSQIHELYQRLSRKHALS